MKKLLCKLFGHRSILIFQNNLKWEHGSWAQTDTVHKCERCGHETSHVWQQGV